MSARIDALWDDLIDSISAERIPDASDLPDGMTFFEWCEQLAASGLKVDGIPFTLEDRPTLRPLYEAIPTTRAEAQRKTVVLMKASQMGATVWQLLAMIYLALRFEPIVVGSYLPDQLTAGDISSRRFMRLIRSIPDVYRKLVTRFLPDNRTERVGEGNVFTKIMGESAFLFLWTSGAVTTESRPMDIQCLDEVQEMSLEQIDKVYERMSASRVRFRLMLSTANMPEDDIDYHFRLGTQRTWHTECPHCSAETDLSANWPGCCVFNTGQVPDAPRDWVYICGECGGWIEDTQVGRYIPLNPDAAFDSFHISQIISPTITPRDMATAWNQAVTGDQRKAFFNRKIGRPYIDAEQLPVTMAHCLACVAEGLKIGLTWEPAGRDTFLGLDQMMAFIVAIVLRRLPDGRMAVMHVEAIFNDDPFARCDVLMEQYGVAVCCIETLPNANEARRFANRWRGRVYLAKYATGAGSDMLTWGDQISRSDRKTADEDRERYAVTIQQYKMMQSALFRVKNQHMLFPDPALLEQNYLDHGEWKMSQIVRDYCFRDYTKTALVVEQDEETRSPKPKVVKLAGIDPHFSFATMLACVAWSRVHGNSMFILPESMRDQEKPKHDLPLAAQFEARMPGLPKPVLDMLDQGVRDGTCGACHEFDPVMKRCKVRLLSVTSDMVQCDLYDPKSNYR